MLRESEAEVGLANNLVTEKQGNISNLEQALAKCKLELNEKEKKLNDAVQVEVIFSKCPCYLICFHQAEY